MLPSVIRRKLSALRLCEGCLRLFWGTVRWLVLIVTLFVMACLVDWAVDRLMPTPFAFRVLMFLGQIGLGLAAIYLFFVRPFRGKMSDSNMALLVEETIPELNHRLISVVQFHQPGAKTEGMSPELIGKVTEETERRTSGLNFAGAADKRRIAWSLAIALPAILLVVLPMLIWPETMQVLFARQLLMNVEIPRSIKIERLEDPKLWASKDINVWPKGEDIVLHFRAYGPGVAKLNDKSQGLVRIDPDRLPSEYYFLKVKSKTESEAILTASLPPGYTSFNYHAWILDGRSDTGWRMKLVPRPVVEEITAWALLPETMGTRPSGGLYQLEQPRGEIVAVRGCSAKVHVKIQKPIEKATLQVLGPTPPLQNPLVIGNAVSQAAAASLGNMLAAIPAMGNQANGDGNQPYSTLGYETVLRDVPLVLQSKGAEAAAVFELPLRSTGYRIIVEDEFGFKNIPAPRRSIRIVSEEPPEVALLPEQFPPDDPFGKQLSTLEDYYVDGAPVPVGSRFRVAYTCNGPFGLGAARLHYRIFKKPADDSVSPTEIVEPKWIVVPLQEVKASPKTGPFDLRRGVFQNSPKKAEIEFHAIPSPLPEQVLGRTEGGGRFDLKLIKLPDGSGKFIPYDPQPGDQLEYFIEVSADKKFNPFRPMARSEVRLKSVVSVLEAVQWVGQALQEESRIRQLEKKQKGVFSAN